MSFSEIPHTADVRIHATAPTLESLFAEAIRALMQVQYGPDRKGGEQRTIRVDGEDRVTLLHDLLSEVLYITEVENLVFADARVHICNGYAEAVLDGEPFDRSRHARGTEVKGISYYELAISQDANGYMLDIVFDV